jgi:hypothetical protein
MLTDRPVRALVCLALFLALQLFAASSPLHQAIHSDANSPGHQCAITMIAQGQVDAPPAWIGWAAFAAVLLFCVPAFSAPRHSLTDLRLAPSRAPPRS